jgi:CIC family chloride channel protein
MHVAFLGHSPAVNPVATISSFTPEMSTSATARRARDGECTQARPEAPAQEQGPFGSWAMEQPNAGGDGDARLTGTFWVALVLTGVAAGGFGIAMMVVLHTVQHLAFDYRSGPFGVAVARASDIRRFGARVLGGAQVGPASYVVRRRYRSQSTDVDDAVWTGTGELPFRRSLATRVISEVAVGSGASLGR